MQKTHSPSMVVLFVKNPLESAKYYTKICDIKPQELLPTFALFKFKNGIDLGLWSIDTAKPKVTNSPGASEITFIEEKIDNFYNYLKKMGTPIFQSLTDMNFGRTFVILDPDGHRIRFFKPKAK